MKYIIIDIKNKRDSYDSRRDARRYETHEHQIEVVFQKEEGSSEK